MLESLRIPTIELTTNLAGCLDTSLADLRESEGHNGVLSQMTSQKHAFIEGHKQTSKRRAAELALNSIYDGEPCTKKRRRSTMSKDAACADALTLGACDESCICRQGSNAWTSTSRSWCTFGVKLPHTNWGAVMESALRHLPARRTKPGCLEYQIEEGVRVYVIETAQALAHALSQLRDSMQDPVVSIDLEWKPEWRRKDSSKVAMIQLATSTVALLIRMSHLGFKMQQDLEQFLRDPDIVVVGFAWDSCDEKKFQKTFRLGRSIIRRFLDLQAVASMLGYQHYGLGSLSQQVMGLDMRKSKRVTLSNWEATKLSTRQILYAAMDALAAGAVFRALRLWHTMPSDCSVCRVPLGSPVSPSVPAQGGGSCLRLDVLGTGRRVGPLRGACKCQSCGRHSADTAEAKGSF